MSSPLGRSEQRLSEVYDLAMLDLDGVVYIGPHAVPGAPAHLQEASRAGMRTAYVTNNASRPPSAVAHHLRELTIPAAATDVVTAAQAAARLIADRFPAGSRVFVIGGQGLFSALDEHDLHGVQAPGDDPVAVVSGYHPDLRWRTVIDGSILVKGGLPWFASNTDLTVPTPRGVGPGNGVLVKVVAEFAGVQPVVAGKPEPPLFQETQRRVGGRRALVVGDRLDTDIEGAVRAGYDSLLVMTGVTTVAELVASPPHRRPTYIAQDLGGLNRPHPPPQRQGDGWSLGGWEAEVADGRLQLEGDGSVDDCWRVVAAAAWTHLDTAGSPARVDTQALPSS